MCLPVMMQRKDCIEDKNFLGSVFGAELEEGVVQWLGQVCVLGQWLDVTQSSWSSQVKKVEVEDHPGVGVNPRQTESPVRLLGEVVEEAVPLQILSTKCIVMFIWSLR
jgi:hypothetical protein